MTDIPVVAFSAWSGTGKTTIIEQLIIRLKQSGIRLAVIKHDAHSFDIDKEGKDSWRFAHAGADMTILSSADKTAIIEQRPLDFDHVIANVHDVDLIIVEGYNNQGLKQIGISRKATGRGFRLPIDSYIAVITDEDIQAEVPKFALNDYDGITEFIISHFLMRD